MPLTTSTIYGRVVLPNDTAFTDGVLVFTMSEPDTEIAQVVAPSGLRVTLNDDYIPAGAVLWRNTEGDRGTTYAVQLEATITSDLGGGQTMAVRKTYSLGSVQVGDLDTYSIGALLRNPVPVGSSWNLNIQDAATARDALGLTIGEDVAAYVGGADNSLMQRKSGAWTHRTIAQVKTDFSLSTADLSDESDLARLADDQTFSGTVNFTGDMLVKATGIANLVAAATLTVANLQNTMIRYNGAAPAALTFPTGTDLNALLTTNLTAFEFSVINTSPSDVTMTANTGVTIIGAAVVAAGTSGRWSLRRVGSATYFANRLA